jgi:molybdopterin-guanine dinucleotide biosynthesis protein A
MRTGAILLVGGGSTRMGRSKAELDWHGEPLGARVARVLGRAVGNGPVIAVGAPGQEALVLPAHVELVADPTAGEGPLRGLATGLAALQGRADVVFVSSVDAPFLSAGLVAAVLGAVGPDDDAAAPVADGRRHPLAAAYRVALLPLCWELLAAGERRPNALLDRVRTRSLDMGAWPDALRNVNTPEEYDTARAEAAPHVTVEASGSPPVEARAWRLGDLALDGHAVAAVNGAPIVFDRWYPLAPGDRVSFNALVHD